MVEYSEEHCECDINHSILYLAVSVVIASFDLSLLLNHRNRFFSSLAYANLHSKFIIYFRNIVCNILSVCNHSFVCPSTSVSIPYQSVSCGARHTQSDYSSVGAPCTVNLSTRESVRIHRGYVPNCFGDGTIPLRYVASNGPCGCAPDTVPCTHFAKLDRESSALAPTLRYRLSD